MSPRPCSLCRRWRRIYFFPLPDSGGYWHPLPYGHIIPISTSIFTSPSSMSVCGQIFLPLIYTCDTFIYMWSLLVSTWIISASQDPLLNHIYKVTFYHIKRHLQVPGIRTRYLWEPWFRPLQHITHIIHLITQPLREI